MQRMKNTSRKANHHPPRTSSHQHDHDDKAHPPNHKHHKKEKSSASYIEVSGKKYYSDRCYLHRPTGIRNFHTTHDKDLNSSPSCLYPLLDRGELIQSLDLQAAILGTYVLDASWMKKEMPSLFPPPSSTSLNERNKTGYSCLQNVPTLVLHGHKGFMSYKSENATKCSEKKKKFRSPPTSKSTRKRRRPRPSTNHPSSDFECRKVPIKQSQQHTCKSAKQDSLQAKITSSSDSASSPHQPSLESCQDIQAHTLNHEDQARATVSETKQELSPEKHANKISFPCEVISLLDDDTTTDEDVDHEYGSENNEYTRDKISHNKKNLEIPIQSEENKPPTQNQNKTHTLVGRNSYHVETSLLHQQHEQQQQPKLDLVVSHLHREQIWKRNKTNHVLPKAQDNENSDQHQPSWCTTASQKSKFPREAEVIVLDSDDGSEQEKKEGAAFHGRKSNLGVNAHHTPAYSPSSPSFTYSDPNPYCSQETFSNTCIKQEITHLPHIVEQTCGRKTEPSRVGKSTKMASKSESITASQDDDDVFTQPPPEEGWLHSEEEEDQKVPLNKRIRSVQQEENEKPLYSKKTANGPLFGASVGFTRVLSRWVPNVAGEQVLQSRSSFGKVKHENTPCVKVEKGVVSPSPFSSSVHAAKSGTAANKHNVHGKKNIFVKQEAKMGLEEVDSGPREVIVLDSSSSEDNDDKMYSHEDNDDETSTDLPFRIKSELLPSTAIKQEHDERKWQQKPSSPQAQSQKSQDSSHKQKKQAKYRSSLGVHHPKFLLLFEKRGSIVVVVSTANLTRPQTIDLAWLQRFEPRHMVHQACKKEETAASDDSENEVDVDRVDDEMRRDGSDFGWVLADFLHRQGQASSLPPGNLHVRDSDDLTESNTVVPDGLTPEDFLRKFLGMANLDEFRRCYRFEDAHVHLVATVPGYHPGRHMSTHLGISEMGDCLDTSTAPPLLSQRTFLYGPQRVSDILYRLQNQQPQEQPQERRRKTSRKRTAASCGELALSVSLRPWMPQGFLSKDDRLIVQPTSFGGNWTRQSLEEVARKYLGMDDLSSKTVALVGESTGFTKSLCCSGIIHNESNRMTKNCVDCGDERGDSEILEQVDERGDSEILEQVDIVWPTQRFMDGCYHKTRAEICTSACDLDAAIDEKPPEIQPEVLDAPLSPTKTFACSLRLMWPVEATMLSPERTKEDDLRGISQGPFAFFSAKSFNSVDLACLSRMALYEPSGVVRCWQQRLSPHVKSVCRLLRPEVDLVSSDEDDEVLIECDKENTASNYLGQYFPPCDETGRPIRLAPRYSSATEVKRKTSSAAQTERLAWFLLTSACLSQGAQGKAVDGRGYERDTMAYANFELGVLFCSRLQGEPATDRLYVWSPESCPYEKHGSFDRRDRGVQQIYLPIPFNLRALSYMQDADDADMTFTPFFHEIPSGTGSVGQMRLTPMGKRLAALHLCES